MRCQETLTVLAVGLPAKKKETNDGTKGDLIQKLFLRVVFFSADPESGSAPAGPVACIQRPTRSSCASAWRQRGGGRDWRQATEPAAASPG